MNTPVWLRLDEDDPSLNRYPALPMGWTLHVGPRRPLSEVYNEAYQFGCDWYGFIADDVVPETPCWDRKLIEVAGTDGMAVPGGGHGGTPHFLLGGDLVRSVGWLALPGLDRIYIDTVWADIAMERGVLRHAGDVILRHHHFSNRLAPFDRTYRKTRKSEDLKVYEIWRKGRDHGDHPS